MYIPRSSGTVMGVIPAHLYLVPLSINPALSAETRDDFQAREWFSIGMGKVAGNRAWFVLNEHADWERIIGSHRGTIPK